MKKMLILALAALMLLSFAAQAQAPVQMEIVNCEEWVSLRAEPDSASDRHAQVPLGETVRGFFGSDGEFSYCEYDGALGYILNEYLQAGAQEAEVTLPQGDPSYELALEDGCVKAWYGYGATSEQLRLGRYDAAGELIWSYRTESLFSSELTAVTAFINDRAQAPLVMVYNASFGLIALDAATGEEIWTLPRGEVSLGASITHAVDDNGDMYIGGYYGPDPVAISAGGEVKWESSSLHRDGATGDELNFSWLDNIVVLSDGIAAHYADPDGSTWVGYDTAGKMISWQQDGN